MNCQEQILKVIFIPLVLTFTYIGHSWGYGAGQASMQAPLAAQKHLAHVNELKWKAADATIKTLKRKDAESQSTIDRLEEFTRQIEDSLRKTEQLVTLRNVTIDSAFAIIDSLCSEISRQDSALTQSEIRYASVKKGKDLQSARLDGAAAEIRALTDTVEQFRPKALEKEQLVEQAHNYRFGFYLLGMLLLVLAYGFFRRGWLAKRKQPAQRPTPVKEPIQEEAIPKLKLSPSLFKKAPAKELGPVIEDKDNEPLEEKVAEKVL